MNQIKGKPEGDRRSKGSSNDQKNGKKNFSNNKRSWAPRESQHRIANLSVLHYGPKCKLYKFQKDLEEYARLNYGDLAMIFVDDSYYVPAPIDIPDDVEDIERIQILEEQKLRLKEIYEMKKNRSKLHAAMWIQLSDESRERIMELPNYNTHIRRGDDPLALWIAIKATHMTIGASSPALNQFHAIKHYQDLKMENNEGLAVYMERFKAAVDTVRITGAPVPDGASQAVSFIMKLDERFHKFQETLRNNDALSIGVFPESLIDAYTAASRYVVSNPRIGTRRDGKFNNSSGEAIFVTCENSKGDKGQQQAKKKSVECFKCGQEGHYARDCTSSQGSGNSGGKDQGKPRANGGNGSQASNKKIPHKNKVAFTSDISTEEDNYDDEDDDYYEGNMALVITSSDLDSNQGTSELVLVSRSVEDDYKLHLDNQATSSLIRNQNLCTNVRHTGKYKIYTGVGGNVTTDLVGELPYFGTVSIMPESPVNIVALNEVEDKYPVSYVPTEGFTVDIGEDAPCVEFRRERSGLYACDFKPFLKPSDGEETYMTTVTENESMYTKDQVERAKVARRFMIEMGCTSAGNLIKLTKGFVLNSPVSAEDIYRATKIYGPLLGAVKGKTKIRKAGKLVIEHVPRPVDTSITLHSDIMFVGKIPFLISVALPLGLVLGNFLVSRADHVMRDAFNGQLKQLQSRLFHVTRIIVDGEGSIYAIRHLLATAGIQLEPTGRAQHVPDVEVRNKVIKEIFRSILLSLPYQLPKFLYKYLVFFAISRINMFPVRSRSDPTPARELFTGRKVDYKKDIRIGFGEYCQVEAFPMPRNDATKSRTKGALSLDPRGNLQGSVRFFILGSEKKKVTVVTRDSWTKMVITNEVIDYINRVKADSEENGNLEVVNEEDVVNDDPVMEQAHVEEAARGARIEEPPRKMTDEGFVPIEDVPDVIPELNQQRELLSESDSSIDSDSDSPELLNYIKSGNVEKVFTTLSYKKGLKKHGELATDAARKELKQMVDLRVWKPVNVKGLESSQRKKVIRSFMFLKEKFRPDGTFEKLKMRLVAGGNMQDKLDMELTSSPTVTLSTVFILFMHAAYYCFKVKTVDIAGAYLNAGMGNTNVFMRIDSDLADVLVEIDKDQDYSVSRQDDGSIVVKLEKALYGCIESAKLWNKHLAKKLIKYGMVQSKLDECLFYKTVANDVVLRVAVYVDDLLICGKTDKDVDDFINYLKEEFKTITVNEGSKQAYLGMNFEMNAPDKKIHVTMEKYVEDVVSTINGTNGCAKTPATSELFFIDDGSPELGSKEQKKFHSMVARVLYLAKRARPDLLTTIAFLATRVKRPTEQDFDKLNRMIKYLRGTASLGIELSMEPGKLEAYVDASHCVHPDGKSQSGILLTLGRGGCFVKSSKQKMVAKSSTEAELIAISDALPTLIWHRELMIEQGMIPPTTPVTIHEDNQSTIALIRRGKPASESTRHINIRHFFISDRCLLNEVRVVYIPTEEQVADYFTKGLVGRIFYSLRKSIVSESNRLVNK